MSGDVRALLPFHANGTLDPQERAAVEAALAADPALAREAEALRRARATLRAEAPPAPGEAGLERLLAAIDAEAARPAAAPPANLDRAPVWRAAAAILAAVALGQAAWIATRPAPETDGYTLAGGPPEGAIRVAFAPDLDEADLRAVLRSAGLEVVGGPSALGLWTLAPVGDGDVDTALDLLRGFPFTESADRIR
ncbi:hypothetical protein JQC91_07010 [Jannaschia sp. Os4]|uniref:hypothetical protein n=1 Tax=Jannaschia sp. Os4 TaxID=2807617 RepID=UPI00193ABC97|nr:hypothetical protein [Jannaschia sp. Os4]MBM2576049.1 hypothetical protein [Jannaschia sp. Os4]